MEYNLKNHPQTIKYHNLGDELSDFEIEINRWFDGFKKELLEFRDFLDGNFKYLEIVRKAHVEMIDNILGEEGKPDIKSI